jgi:hypothetical protein
MYRLGPASERGCSVERHYYQIEDRQAVALARAYRKVQCLAATRILQRAKEAPGLPELIAWIENEFQLEEK